MCIENSRHFKWQDLLFLYHIRIGSRIVFGSGLRSILGWLLAACLLISPATARPTANFQPVNQDSTVSPQFDVPWVDSTRIRHLYMDGEFEQAIALLEANLKETRQYSHDDSVFIFKHLGVMYAAQYETREKGKYYMHRLLEVEPTAKIMDMYASDMIYMIFKNVQEEYEQKRMVVGTQSRKEDEREANVRPDPKRRVSLKDTVPLGASFGTKKWVWTGVAAGTLAIGIGAYILFSDGAKGPRKEVEF